MQPTYLPWEGLFAMISLSDRFVFLDDVQHDRRSWQVRNKIMLNGGEHTLTIPIRRTARNSCLNTIMINDDFNWRYKHIETLKQSYKKTRYGVEVLDAINIQIANTAIQNLSEFTSGIIMTLANSLGLDTKFSFSSHIKSEGKRSQKLLSICKFYEAQEYLSPIGSRDYLFADDVFPKNTVQLKFFNYEQVPYKQNKSSKFVERLSVVDVISNIGIAQARQNIKAGGLIYGL